MGVEVATTCLQWSQPIVPLSPSSSQALASVVSSPSRRLRSHRAVGGALVCRYVQRLDRSTLFGTGLTNLYRTRSVEYQKPKFRTLKRACSASASFDAFSDEEFSKKIQELALRFQLSDDESTSLDSESEIVPNEIIADSSVNFLENQSTVEPPWPEIPPDWVGRDEIIPASIERKANSVDLPLSLRMIKRKMQWQEGFREVGESAYSSVKKAFSSMVFIIRELHSYTLQMREFLFYEDLQEILVRVQKEMHASFVWLFQQVFSHTPTLMMYVMILLANFTVHSMGHNAAIAASLPQVGSQMESMVEIQDQKHQKFDSSTIKTFSASSSSGKMTSIGGNNGGGGKVRPIASGTDGDGGFDGSNQYRTILPDGSSSSSSSSQLSSYGTTREAAESETREEEMNLWNSIVEEASEMQASLRDKALDQETMQRFVSPVRAQIEADNDYADYFRTELLYQMGLVQDPNNPLLLANYAQFLYVVAHDYDRYKFNFSL